MPMYNALARDAALRHSASIVPTIPATMSNPNTTPLLVPSKESATKVYIVGICSASPSPFNAAVTAICIAPCTQKHVNHGGAWKVPVFNTIGTIVKSGRPTKDGFSTSVFMLMTGMLDSAIPTMSSGKKWTEVINQFLNALFTIMCLY
uniref:Uncharacterized protein n=1 Tax=Oryza sativa subsp. japonica TaxID=39947 RepID=Q6YVJ5_ORYSJ|nr:hypothetical protein [Oryza sativa Japonica Group]BAD08070.1 hypothetical protein [Oryza sativa Japonica Group]